jgi:hypothetical protein
MKWFVTAGNRLDHVAIYRWKPDDAQTPLKLAALFGTAWFAQALQPTGISDQWPERGGRRYGSGFWEQQWLGVARLYAAAAPRRRR